MIIIILFSFMSRPLKYAMLVVGEMNTKSGIIVTPLF